MSTKFRKLLLTVACAAAVTLELKGIDGHALTLFQAAITAFWIWEV